MLVPSTPGKKGFKPIEESVDPAVWNSTPSQMDERCKLVPNSASGEQCVITRICQFEGGMHVDEVIDPIQTCFLCVMALSLDDPSRQVRYHAEYVSNVIIRYTQRSNWCRNSDETRTFRCQARTTLVLTPTTSTFGIWRSLRRYVS